MRSSPIVSFIVPHRNHGGLLAGCIQSCLTASSQACEVVVIDDASDDGSLKATLAWEGRDERVQVLLNESQQGVERTLNRGLAVARGDFVVFRAADDLCLPGFLDEAVAALQENPSADYCVGDIRFFVDEVASGRVESMGIGENPVFVRPERWNEDFGGDGLTVAASLIRKEAVLGIGGMDASLRWLSDWAMMAELGFSRGMVYLPKPCCAMKIHGASYNSVGSASGLANRQALAAMLERLASKEAAFVEALVEARVLGFFRSGLVTLGEEGLSQGARLLRRSALAPRPEVRERCGMGRAIDAFLGENEAVLRGASSVALYGVGGHTRLMLAAWRERGLPLPSVVMSSQAPAAAAFEGIAWRRAEEVAEEGCEVVVLSSKSYESELAKLAAEWFPQAKVLRVWG